MSLRKKIANFWFYYKIPVLVVVASTAIIIYSIVQQLSVPDAEFGVGIIDSADHDTAEFTALQSALERNGVYTVAIRAYQMTIGVAGEDTTIMARLDADLGSAYSGMFLVEDPDAFRENVSFAHDAVFGPQVKDTFLAGLGFDELYVYYIPSQQEHYSCLLADPIDP